MENLFAVSFFQKINYLLSEIFNSTHPLTLFGKLWHNSSHSTACGISRSGSEMDP